jgi:hypothetical protein
MFSTWQLRQVVGSCLVRLLPQPHDIVQSLNGASAAVPKLTFDVNIQVRCVLNIRNR